MAVERRQNELSASRIAETLCAELIGDGQRTVTDVQFIQSAKESDLAFVGSARFMNKIAGSQARVILIPQACSAEIAEYSDRTFVLVSEPEVAFLQIAEMLLPQRTRQRTGISMQSVVATTAQIGCNTNIQPFASVGDGAVIGEDCEIGHGVVIGEGCVIGDNVRLDAYVVLYPDVVIGNNVIIHAGTVIGSDGFGYRTVRGRHIRLPHFGRVRICDDVEIGAGVTIDRAKMGETVIGEGTKIDNQVVVAHNCQIGKHNLLVSQTGIAGSCTTGEYVVCAGQSGIADHVHLGDGAIIGAKAGVHRDMPGGQSYLGSPARNASEHAREVMTMKKLPEMRSAIRTLEKQMAVLMQQLEQTRNENDAGSSCDRDAA